MKNQDIQENMHESLTELDSDVESKV